MVFYDKMNIYGKIEVSSSEFSVMRNVFYILTLANIMGRHMRQSTVPAGVCTFAA